MRIDIKLRRERLMKIKSSGRYMVSLHNNIDSSTYLISKLGSSHQNIKVIGDIHVQYLRSTDPHNPSFSVSVEYNRPKSLIGGWIVDELVENIKAPMKRYITRPVVLPDVIYEKPTPH